MSDKIDETFILIKIVQFLPIAYMGYIDYLYFCVWHDGHTMILDQHIMLV